MKRHISTLVAFSLIAVIGRAAEPVQPTVTVSDPVTHANLTLFVLHGKNAVGAERKILTLQEALDQKKLVVHETSNVNQLSVENVSDDVDVFIQSCDIVKGGKQDRVIATDMLLSPKSGQTPIASFCCEHGRWQKRGAEEAARFETSQAFVGNNGLKNAVNGSTMGGRGDQGKVWDEVGKAQKQLSEKTAKPVTENASPSSYQLALESKPVQENIAEYVKALSKAIDGHTDAIGVAIVVNGKVRSVDIYGSNALLTKMWTKLVTGAAVDALSEIEKDKKFEPAAKADVEKWLAQAEKGKWAEAPAAPTPAQNANPPAQTSATEKSDLKAVRSRVMRCDSEKILLLETQDTKSADQMVHRTYLAK